MIMMQIEGDEQKMYESNKFSALIRIQVNMRNMQLF